MWVSAVKLECCKVGRCKHNPRLGARYQRAQGLSTDFGKWLKETKRSF
jgi:hypothetical protein